MTMQQIKPRFDPTVQLGHIVQAVILLITIAIGWENVRSELAQHDKDLVRHSQEIQLLKEADASIRETQNRLSENLVRLSAIIEERTHRLSQP